MEKPGTLAVGDDHNLCKGDDRNEEGCHRQGGWKPEVSVPWQGEVQICQRRRDPKKADGALKEFNA